MRRIRIVMKNNIKQVSGIIRKMPSSKFSNEYGEDFTIYSNGNTVYMEGDEVNAMVDENNKFDGILPLFNPAFSIWSVDELWKLGASLQDVAVQNGYSTEQDETLEYKDYEIYARVGISTDDMFAIDKNGNLKNAQGFSSGQDKHILWYEIVGGGEGTLDVFDKLHTIQEAKDYIDKYISQHELNEAK